MHFSCNPVEPTNGLQIKLEDVSCTEVRINVTGETGGEIILNRDDKEVQRFTLLSSPQTIYDDSLLPNKTYTYQVFSIQNQGSPEGTSSNKITATTLDTTSNNFIWQTFTFGDPGAGSSNLNDVVIVNDTLAYAVGEIYLNDSTGQPDPNAYNLIKWNGIFMAIVTSSILYILVDNNILVLIELMVLLISNDTTHLDCFRNRLQTISCMECDETNQYYVSSGICFKNVGCK